jgi:phage shock protein C
MSEVKRLYRSREDRVISGVCGGLAEYLGMDPTIIRLLFALTLIFAGGGLLVYIVMVVVVPEQPIAGGAMVGAEKAPAAAPRAAAKPKTAAKRKTATKK